ncbi:MAG: hypothetical protein J7501_06835 [Bdellovibrio sp.]|nr:hypothetical protein [Bdellovibrio sp.]
MRTIILLFFVLTLGVVSCAPQASVETREEALRKGFRLNDQGKYDEAISYFEALLQKNPHYQVRLALASSYAARAGVKIENIYGFVMVKARPDTHFDFSGVMLDQQTQKMVRSLQQFAQQWNLIPTANVAARADLQNALTVLANNTEPGVRLYAATLRVIILKSAILEGVESWNYVTQSRGKKLCTKDIKPYWTWSLKILDGLKSLAFDLELSFPHRQAEFAAYREQIGEVQELALQTKIPEEDRCY